MYQYILVDTARHVKICKYMINIDRQVKIASEAP